MSQPMTDRDDLLGLLAVRTNLLPPEALDALLHECRRDNAPLRSEEHTSELQSLTNIVCRLLLAKTKALTPLLHFSSYSPDRPYYLLSFPTRRSSDLVA